MSNTKSDSTRAALRETEAKIRRNHEGKGAMQRMDPPIQESAAATKAKEGLRNAADRALKRR